MCADVAHELVRIRGTPWAYVMAWGFRDDPLRASAQGRLPDVTAVVLLQDDQYAVLRCFSGGR